MTANVLSKGNRPITFRRELITKLLATLTAGESCSLVGVGSSGKSNVARHLARRDVLEYHLGARASSRLAALVNCTDLSEYTPPALHRLMLEALAKAMQQATHLPAQAQEQVAALFDQAIEASSPERVRSNFKDALVCAFTAGVDQIFILLDDFDHVVQSAPSPVLNGLRPFRDDHKGRLAYATFTRRELAYLRPEAEFQEFYELVAPNTVAIGPLSDADARAMIQQLGAQWDLAARLPAAAVERLIELSGRHPGLIRAILTAMRHHDRIRLAEPEALDRLKTHVDVEPECKNIWESLEPEERDDLIAIHQQRSPYGAGLGPLRHKELIRPHPTGSYRIFSPIFAAFVAAQASSSDAAGDAAGNATCDLDAIVLRLFSRICERYPSPATREDLLDSMWAGERATGRYGSSNPERRLSNYLDVLKRKLDAIKPNCLHIQPDGSCRLVL